MIDGGFHYPQDWGYKVQNFSSIRYTRELSAGEEATFMYPFMAAELAGGRSYGLQLNLHYSANQCKFSTYRIFRYLEVDSQTSLTLQNSNLMFYFSSTTILFRSLL